MNDEEILRRASSWADHDHRLGDTQRAAIYAAQTALEKVANDESYNLFEEHMADLLRLVITKRYP